MQQPDGEMDLWLRPLNVVVAIRDGRIFSNITPGQGHLKKQL